MTSAVTGASSRRWRGSTTWPGRCPTSRWWTSIWPTDRRLIVHHRALNRVLLDEKDARLVLQHLADLWGYDVVLKEVDPADDARAEGTRRFAARWNPGRAVANTPYSSSPASTRRPPSAARGPRIELGDGEIVLFRDVISVFPAWRWRRSTLDAAAAAAQRGRRAGDQALIVAAGPNKEGPGCPGPSHCQATPAERLALRPRTSSLSRRSRPHRHSDATNNETLDHLLSAC